MKQFEVIYLQLENNKEPLAKWLKTLDNITRKRILQRLLRLTEGNFGDYKKIDEDISEIKFTFGSGYRIYFTEINDMILLLINSGDKSTQQKDIRKAKELLEQWRAEND